jgi:Na+/H+-translocating membrane pyrophosphatase
MTEIRYTITKETNQELYMETGTEIIKVELTNGTIIHVQVTALGGEEEVAFILPAFKGVTDAIEGIAESVVTTLQKVKPHKASVEFGLEVALESGQLTALLVKGSGSSNLKITLEWGE